MAKGKVTTNIQKRELTYIDKDGRELTPQEFHAKYSSSGINLGTNRVNLSGEGN